MTRHPYPKKKKKNWTWQQNLGGEKSIKKRKSSTTTTSGYFCSVSLLKRVGLLSHEVRRMTKIHYRNVRVTCETQHTPEKTNIYIYIYISMRISGDFNIIN